MQFLCDLIGTSRIFLSVHVGHVRQGGGQRSKSLWCCQSL